MFLLLFMFSRIDRSVLVSRLSQTLLVGSHLDIFVPFFCVFISCIFMLRFVATGMISRSGSRFVLK